MATSVDPPSQDQAHEEPNVQYVLTGSGTTNDGKSLEGVVFVDPTTGLAMVPGSVTFTSLSIADGADVAEGTTTDAATANTVIGRLKKLISLVPTALTGSGNLKTAIQEALPAGTNLLGKVGIDQTTPGTTNGVQVNAALPAGSNTIGGVTVADGADVAEGSTTDSAGDPTVVGQLKRIGRKGSPACTSVTVSTTPTLLLAANGSRVSAVIQNVTGGSALVLGHDANVVASSPGEGQYLGLVVVAGGDAEDTDSSGDWFGVCASGSADVRICEVS